MLSRVAFALSVAVTLVVGGRTFGEVPAGVTCGSGVQFCVVEVRTPGVPGASGAAPSSVSSAAPAAQACVASTGEQVPCFDPGFGWFNAADSCYWKPVAPQPAGDSPIWGGHFPNGQVWSFVCIVQVPGSHAGWAWLASAPPGYGGGPSPAQLAQQAVAQMQLTGPVIGLSIPADQFGVVGVPVWLWTAVGPTTWGPNTATASVAGLSVTAVAQAQSISWDTGDGRHETCANPGTAYYPGGVTSPTCQHIYDRSSAGQPGEAYPITATTTWLVSWTGGGDSGQLTVTRTATSRVRIGEVQVLVTNQ